MLIAAWLTDALAIYGAALSTATALAGYFTWRLGIKTRVKVELLPMVLHDPQGPDTPIVMVRMINHSHHEVAVTHVSFQRRDTDQHLFIPRPLPVHEPLPIVIASRRSKDVWVEQQTLAEHLKEPLRAKVSTDNGNTFRSKQVVLADVTRRHLAEAEAKRLARSK